MSHQKTGKEAGPSTATPFYKKPVPVAVILCIVLVLVLLGGWYWVVSQQYVSTQNAFLKGHLVQVSPQVSGPIARILVERKEHVEKGELLVRIASADYQVALAQAKARLESARSGLEQARAKVRVATASVAQARDKVAVAEARAADARSSFRRLQKLNELDVSEQKVESARHRMVQMQASAEAARQRVETKEARVGVARANIQVASAALAEAKAAVDQARLRLSYTRITAPVSGQVARLGVDVGEYVRAGQPLLTVVPPRIWVKANFKETQITHMRTGQPVEIHIDAYPDRTFHGHVAGIQHATGAQFALLPPQNATGNFIKIVQRVPVKIVFNDDPNLYVPAPGLSVVPTVKVLEHPPWPW